jgi:hypothetical protein
MANTRIPQDVGNSFLPSEIEAVSGLAPSTLRNWRARGLVHKSLGDGWQRFPAEAVAELLVLKRLSDAGIGPKQVYGWTGAIAAHVYQLAIDHPDAFGSAAEYAAWKRGPVLGDGVLEIRQPKPNPLRFTVVGPSGVRSFAVAADLVRFLNQTGAGVVLDLEALAMQLRTRAGKPLVRLEWREIVNSDGTLIERPR